MHVVVLLVLQSFTHQIANRQNHTSFREIAVFVMGCLFEDTFESIRLHTMLQVVPHFLNPSLSPSAIKSKDQST